MPIEKEESKLQVFLNTYQVLRNNIEFYKRQQWQISYYAIAVNAALSFLNLDKSACYPGLKFPIMALGILASIISMIVIIRLENSIKSELKSVKRIENTIPLLKSITNFDYTTMNVKKNVEKDSYIFYTGDQRADDKEEVAHSLLIFLVSIITVLISLCFLFWILGL